MSEYQYYEFRAIDQPLDEKAMQALRDLSSRGQITPTSFINEYNWGDFKGSPLLAKLLFGKWDLWENTAGTGLTSSQKAVIEKEVEEIRQKLHRRSEFVLDK